MKNAVQPIVELTVGEDTFKLAFDFEAISEVEELTDRPLLTGLTKRTVDHPTIAFVRAMLFAAVRKYHPDVTFSEAKALVRQDNLFEMWPKILDAFVLFRHAKEDEEQSDQDPT